MKAAERLWPLLRVVVAHDVELTLCPAPSVDKASLSRAQCRPTLHHVNLPEVGLCLVHQYLLQTSQLVEEILSEKPAWGGRHL